ncbi:hypothetical protein [Methylobacterium haplocladii]|uniref:Uncharacterized protein n=1 Tax=Methylobacterium haplocladii TaxID=1176176 RepID=A0A512ISC6_9HYPH|nr:hypothetical protein [Methylobacterium haplocladii]GEP00539.1 hypothetical protein MHA02_29260 [Methylobacterium haplocladii]GJD85453.1 hypothetical protein HPGCJGGD_3342 [Methylobacterium haplocladii]GLS57839.1 hypothetical protein GCM10007887_04950 [Methylobacterium haplocladii]
MSAALKRRFEYASELRTYADRVDALELADRKDPERPIVAKIALAQEMRARAAEVMRREDPAERGIIRAETVFAARTGKPASPVKVTVQRPRVGGVIGLAKAA